MDDPVKRVQIVLHAHLRRFAKSDTPLVEICVDGGATLANVLAELGVPQREVFLLMADGQRVLLDHVPADGDRIEALPVITGG